MKKVMVFIGLIVLLFGSNIDVYAKEELESGVYYIHPKHAKDKVIDVYNNGKDNGEYIILYDKNDPATENQQFIVTKNSDGYYIVMPLSSGKVLDVKGGNKHELANIIQYDFHGGENQLWKIEDEGEGYFSVRAKYDNDMCWDIYQASNLNGKPLSIYPCNGGDNQKFKFEKVDKTVYGPILKNSDGFKRVKKSAFEYKVSLKKNCKHELITRTCLVNDATGDMYLVVASECKKCGEIVSYAPWSIPNGDP